VIIITTKKKNGEPKTLTSKPGLQEVVVVGYGTKSVDPEGAQTLKGLVVVADSTRVSNVKGDVEEVVVTGYAMQRDKPTVTNVKRGDVEEVVVTGYATPRVTTAGKVSGLTLSTTKGKNYENENEGASATVSPNPGTGIFNLAYTLPKEGKGYIEVKDMSGRPVYNKQISGPGNFNEKIDLSRFPAGIYILTLSAPGVKITSRLSKT
jgi:hypothetical protein